MDAKSRGVLEVARSVLAELDLDLVLDRVLEAAQELTEARYAALGVLDGDRAELARFITRGIDPASHAIIGDLPRGRGVLGVLIDRPEPLRLADVGRHSHSYGFPPGHPPMRSFLGVPIVLDGEPYGNLYLTEKQGGDEFTAEDEEAVVTLAEFAGLAIDHARRYTGASERRDELERTVAALEATTQVSRALGGETDIDLVLELIAKRGRALVSARVLVIELCEREHLAVAAAAGEAPDGIMGERIPLAGTLGERALESGRTHRLEGDLNQARFREQGLGSLGVSAQAGLVVPLVFRGVGHGVLVAIDRLSGGPAFTREDERLLEAFATSAATAVATARSVASERERQRLAAADAERTRWARELHDETLQSLSALRISLSVAGRKQELEAIKGIVVDAVALLDEGIADLRALITDLRPAALDELGLGAAMEGLVERSARHGIEVALDIDLAYEAGREETRLAAEVETAVYRIAQEALTNATKHGSAAHATVEITEDREILTLTVKDDGSGFDPRERGQGFGLLGMQERVDLLAGTLSLESALGSGTQLTVTIPVSRSAARNEGGRMSQAS